jgi:ABC-type uncharacterized transport system substrate-binding protein
MRSRHAHTCHAPSLHHEVLLEPRKTGVNSFLAELGAKQLGLLRELLPAAARIGLLANPINANVEGVMKDVAAGAATIGLQIDIVQATDSREIETAFATLVRLWSATTRSSTAGVSS